MDNTTRDNQAPATPPEPTPEAPAVQGNEAPAQPDPASPRPKWRSPKVLAAGIAAAALVVIGGGSALAYTMWYQNPDKVVHDAIMHMVQAKTMSVAGTVSYKGDGVTVDVDLDSKQGAEGSGEFTVNAKVAIDTAGMKEDFNATGTGRYIDDTLYIKLSGLRDVVDDVARQSGGQIPEYAADIFDKIEDKWISIKASDYQDINEEISKQQTCFTDLMEKTQSDKSMTNELMQLYRDNQVVVVKDELGSKSVNGNGSLGYTVEVDKDATVSFVKGLDGTAFGKELKNCDETIDFNEIASDINEETIEEEDVPTIELWVSRFGHRLTEFSIRGGNDEDGTLNILMNPLFDQEVTVEAPSDATPLKTVLEDIQNTIMEYYMNASSEEDLMIEGLENELEMSSAIEL